MCGIALDQETGAFKTGLIVANSGGRDSTI